MPDVRAALVLLLPLLLAADDDELGRRLQGALSRRGREVHACYGEALDRDPQAQGELLVQIEMAEAGRVRRVEILKDQSTAPGLGACLTEMISRWSLGELQAAPGDRVVFPLVFRPDQALPAAPPVVVKPGPLPYGRGSVTKPNRDHKGAGAISEASHPGTQATLALKAAGRDRAPFVQARGDAVLYVLSGAGQLRGDGGVTFALGPGDAALVPAGAGYALSGSLRYTVIESTAVAQRSGGAPLLIRGGKTELLPILGGRGRVRILVERQAVSLEELSCEAGVAIPTHQHDDSDEILYIVSGRGVMSAGAQKDLPIGPGDAVRVPRGVPHGLLVKERLVAVQSYAPAGPEQRFRRAPAANPLTR